MEQGLSSSYLVLPDHEHCRVLVVHDDGGWTLPCVTEHPDGSWQIPHLGFPTPMTTEVISELKESLGLEIILLHSIDCDDPDSGNSFKLHALENRSAGWEPPDGGRWVSREEHHSSLLQPRLFSG